MIMNDLTQIMKQTFLLIIYIKQIKHTAICAYM